MPIIVSLGSYDGRLLGYDLIEKQWIFGYSAHNNCIKSLSSNRHLLCSASNDDTCRVFNLKTKKDLGQLQGEIKTSSGKTISGHEGEVREIVVLKSHIISGGQDGKLCVWNHQQGLGLLHTFKSKSGVVTCAVDPKEKILLAAHEDSYLRMWQLSDGAAIWHMGLDKGVLISKLIFSLDSQWVCILTRDGLNTQLLHMPTGSMKCIVRKNQLERITACCFVEGTGSSTVTTGNCNTNRLVLGDAQGKLWTCEIGEDEAEDKTKTHLKVVEITCNDDLDSVSEEESNEGSEEEATITKESKSKSDSKNIDSTTGPSSRRIRCLSALGQLVSVAFSNGDIELWNFNLSNTDDDNENADSDSDGNTNTAAKEIQIVTDESNNNIAKKTASFSVGDRLRITSIALSYVPDSNTDSKDKINDDDEEESEDEKAADSDSESANSDSESEDLNVINESNNNEMEASDGEDDSSVDAEVEEAGKLLEALPAEQLLDVKKKKKRGLRSGVAKKVQQMELVEKKLLEKFKNNNHSNVTVKKPSSMIKESLTKSSKNKVKKGVSFATDDDLVQAIEPSSESNANGSENYSTKLAHLKRLQALSNAKIQSEKKTKKLQKLSNKEKLKKDRELYEKRVEEKEKEKKKRKEKEAKKREEKEHLENVKKLREGRNDSGGGKKSKSSKKGGVSDKKKSTSSSSKFGAKNPKKNFGKKSGAKGSMKKKGGRK